MLRRTLLVRPASARGVYWFATLAYIGLRLGEFLPTSAWTFPDTGTYLHTANAPFLSNESLAGYRPFTVPLLYRTLLGGWAYGALCRNSTERTATLDGWLWYYNHQRRHAALGHKPPIARLNERTNLLGTYI